MSMYVKMRVCCIFFSLTLVIGGMWLAALAPDIAHHRAVEKFGEAHRWSGSWGLTNHGCFFHPDHARWERNFTIAGWSMSFLGICCGGWVFKRNALR